MDGPTHLSMNLGGRARCPSAPAIWTCYDFTARWDRRALPPG